MRLFRLPNSVRRVQRDVDDEIRFHLESRVADLVARGARPDVARDLAGQEFGDIGEARAELATVDRRRLTRERRADWWEGARQDLSYSVRALQKQPAFTAVVIVVLALGIGANATMFGVIDRLLLRPPAHVADPGRLMTVALVRTRDGEDRVQEVLSYPIYRDLRESRGAFNHVAAFAPVDLALDRGADARQLRGLSVTASYFAALGVRPALGRFFAPAEDGNPTAPAVAVLSFRFWRAELDGDRAVLGRTLELGDRAYTVIGVAPEGFVGTVPSRVDVWIPMTVGITASEYEGWLRSRQGYWLTVVARLRRDISPIQAAEMGTAAIRAGDERAGETPHQIALRRPRARLVSVLPRHALAGSADARVAILLGAVSLLVLLIACANVANLQLARGITRRREVAVRVALGIDRGRLVRQLAIESVLLALGAAAAALAVTVWGGDVVRRMLFDAAAGAAAPLDARLVGYAALTALVAGVLCGTVPALQSARLLKRDAALTSALKAGARGAGHRRTAAQTTLLVVQAALSVVLLIGTGLFVRSLRRIEALPLGMEPERVLVVQAQTSTSGYTHREIDVLYRRLEETARSSPGVESTALGVSLPFSSSYAEEVKVPGRDSLPLPRDGGPYFNAVGADYFRTMGMRLLRGRGFTDRDGPGGARVVVVNETLARMWWPHEDAIGRCMKIGGGTMPCSEVVGMVANARRQALLEDESVQFFVPIEQAPAWATSRILVVRGDRTGAPQSESLRRRLQAGVPNVPYVQVAPLADFVAPQARSWQLGATMFGAFGALALVVAALGLYSVLAYDVSRRTHELGVRVALGARAADVAGMILGRAVRIASLGAAIGFAIAIAAGSVIAPLLFETSAREPLVFGSVAATLALVALLSALVPARRALRVDPIVALRAE